MKPVSSWGRLSADRHDVISLYDQEGTRTEIPGAPHPGLAFGLGRSYGDVCLNPNGVLWDMRGLDRFVRFDAGTGALTCEAGVSLKEIQESLVPHGWMLAVTPGTKFVTVGGAIANDVHGKNHHVHGTFGEHVRRIRLLRTDGTMLECSPLEHADWFAATVGGLGLTGTILEADLQLRRVNGPWLSAETIPFFSIEQFFSLADASEENWEYTVSWIDCVVGRGRGIFMRANPANTVNGPIPKGGKISMPIVPPVSLVNRLSLRAFNSVYFNLGRLRSGQSIVHYEPFFYPLDNINHWNRMYGPKGFFQYQSVVPRSADGSIGDMLDAIAKSGEGSFLAVLKTFGDREPIGMLSFPREGVTLALDFPNAGPRTQKLFERLDAIVREAGGRIYPAKDARMPRGLFELGYPRLRDFLPFRDPGISSAFSRRVMGD